MSNHGARIETRSGIVGRRQSWNRPVSNHGARIETFEVAGETLITTPAQTVIEQKLAEAEGLRERMSGAELAGEVGRAMQVAGAQSLLMGGGPVAVEGLGRGAMGDFRKPGTESARGGERGSEMSEENWDGAGQSFAASAPKPAMEGVVVLSGDEFGSGLDVTQLRKAAGEKLNSLRRTYVLDSRGTPILFDRRGAREAVSGSRRMEELQALAGIEDLIAGAIYDGPEVDKYGDPNVKSWHRYHAPVQIAGRDYTMILKVRELHDGHRFYDSYTLKEMEPAAKAGTASETVRGPTPEATGSKVNKEDNGPDVKDEYAGRAMPDVYATGSAPGAGPAGGAGVARPEWVRAGAETGAGKRLLRRMEGKKPAGLRHVVEYINHAVGVEMRRSRSQTSGRHPAHYRPRGHFTMTRSVQSQINFHEAGHGLKELVEARAPGELDKLSGGWLALTRRPGSMASARNVHEGVAEWLRLRMVDPGAVEGSPREHHGAILPEDIGLTFSKSDEFLTKESATGWPESGNRSPDILLADSLF